jgi:hypothetical protein
MSVKLNFTKVGIISITTVVGALIGKIVSVAGVPYATEAGLIVGLVVGAAVEIETQVLTDSTSA